MPQGSLVKGATTQRMSHGYLMNSYFFFFAFLVPFGSGDVRIVTESNGSFVVAVVVVVVVVVVVIGIVDGLPGAVVVGGACSGVDSDCSTREVNDDGRAFSECGSEVFLFFASASPKTRGYSKTK
jgi:hypothetical protein